MTGVELLAGAAVGYLVRKLRRVGGEADAEVDRVLDEGMDALHELITKRLGDDRALERLRAEAPAGAESELTVRRPADAVAQAALDDEGFAAGLKRLVDRLNDHTAAGRPGGTYNVISGGTLHGPVIQGRDFTGAITIGHAAPGAGTGGEGKGAAPGSMSDVPEPGHTQNQQRGVVIGPTIMGRDIKVVLPPRVPTATSGLPAGSPAFTGRQADLDRLLAHLAPPPGTGDRPWW